MNAMQGDEELLEIGPRRRRPFVGRVLAILLLAGALGGYLALHQHEPARRQAVGTASPPGPSAVSGAASPTGPPPWPQRASACGGTSFLPLVSAQPLDRRTGIRALVGDRLAAVDVDTGAVRPAAGLPGGEYAADVVTTVEGTYALLESCDPASGRPSRLARVDGRGALRVISRGSYDGLLAGGAHPWAVIFDASGGRTWLDPLDGGPRRRLPAGFSPVAAYGDLVVGSVEPPGGSGDAPFRIQALDPVTGRIRVQLGPARSVAVSHGIVLWTPPGCATCRIHEYDLATGRRSETRQAVARVAAWTGVVSPDGRTAAFIRQRTTRAAYATDHPGNPNEVVTVDLASGAARTVPGLVLWAKSLPGLAFSTDSRWLLIGLDEGSGVRLLVWRPGLDAPRESPARLAGKVAYGPDLTPLG